MLEDRPIVTVAVYFNMRLYNDSFHLLITSSLEPLMLSQPASVPSMDLIWDAFRSNLDREAKRNMTKLDSLSKRPHIPQKPLHTQTQPSGLAKDITLHKYQSDCVSWMKTIEANVKTQSIFLAVLADMLRICVFSLRLLENFRLLSHARPNYSRHLHHSRQNTQISLFS